MTVESLLLGEIFRLPNNPLAAALTLTSEKYRGFFCVWPSYDLLGRNRMRPYGVSTQVLSG
jgi:hypothetical protein